MWSANRVSVPRLMTSRRLGALCSCSTEGYLARRTVRLRPRLTPSVAIFLSGKGGESNAADPLPWLQICTWAEDCAVREQRNVRQSFPGHRVTYRVFNDLGRQKQLRQWAPTPRPEQRTRYAQRTDRCLGRLAPRQTKRARHNTHRTAPCSGSTIFSESA